MENLSKEELIKELITVDDITSKISDLTNRFDDFLRRFEVEDLKNAQYHQRELVEVNPIPPSISDEELELNICEALSLTSHEVKPKRLTSFPLFEEKRIGYCEIQMQKT